MFTDYSILNNFQWIVLKLEKREERWTCPWIINPLKSSGKCRMSCNNYSCASHLQRNHIVIVRNPCHILKGDLCWFVCFVRMSVTRLKVHCPTSVPFSRTLLLFVFGFSLLWNNVVINPPILKGVRESLSRWWNIIHSNAQQTVIQHFICSIGAWQRNFV